MPTEANTVLSDEQVDEILARANTATRGPWHTAKRRPALVVAADRARVADCHVGIGMAVDEAQLNSEFIAYARDDIPALCATVKALRAENEQLRAELNGSAESIINEAGKVGQLMDLAAANAVRESLDCAIELCKAKAADAEDRLGMVPGNIAFENGRKKMAEELAAELEALK